MFKILMAIAATLTLSALCLLPISGPSVGISWFDKVEHFIAFGLLAAIWSVAVGGRYLAVAIGVSLFGFLIEVGQSFLPPRNADWADWIADTMGIIVFLLATSSATKYIGNRKHV